MHESTRSWLKSVSKLCTGVIILALILWGIALTRDVTQAEARIIILEQRLVKAEDRIKKMGSTRSLAKRGDSAKP